MGTDSETIFTIENDEVEELEDIEETVMDKMTTELAEFICDSICGKIAGMSEEDAAEICAECGMAEHIIKIDNAYNELNNFDQTQAAAVMKKYSGITICNECANLGVNQNEKYCKNGDGMLIDKITDLDGCSNGKRK